MKNGNRIRTALMALAASLVLFGASSSNATTITYRADSVTSVDGTGGATGFDGLSNPEFDIDNNWVDAGFAFPGESFSVEISECQFLSNSTTAEGACNQGLNLTGSPSDPWTSRVEWTVTNNTGLDGPALLFFAGLQQFADPSDPSSPAADQYDPTSVGIVIESEDFSIVRYQGQSGDFFYLAFLIEDFSQAATFEFTYEVTEDIVGFNTPDLGTPILGMAAHFNPVAVPEPSASVMITVGLVGLLYVGRRRSR